MAELTLLTVPDPTLRAKCVEVPSQLNLMDARDQFIKMMVAHEGVGLAAPQTGLLYRFFVMSPTGKKQDAFIVINPRIVKAEEWGEFGIEGCLSIPGVRIPIQRYKTVHVEYETMRIRSSSSERLKKSERLTDWPSRIFQHENDHLDGVLISDRFQEQSGVAPSDMWSTDPLDDLCR